MAKTDEHTEIVKRIENDLAAWEKRRKAYQDDTEFAVIAGSKQWEEAEWNRRGSAGLPRITYNQFPPLIRNVSNSIMSKEYAVSVSAQGLGSSQEAAEFRGGMIRAIQITGGAQYARDAAVRCAVTGGFGFYRLSVVEVAGKTRLKYVRITNALNVVPDPNAREINFSDMKCCTVYVDLPKDEYKAKWPNGKAVDVSGDFQQIPDGWVTEETVRVAEYWTVDGFDANGRPQVFQTILDGAGILQPAKLEAWCVGIPIFTVVGEENDIGGEKIYKGIVRDGREPQMFKNLWKSEEYEYLSGRKQPPALMTPKMVADAKVNETWGPGSERNAYRLWEPDPMVPGMAPIFPPAPSVPVGYANASQEASQEIKVATGLFDGRMGAQTQETSGRALLVRQEQANVADAHLEMHLKAAIEYEGRILNDALWIYSDEEMVEFAAEDGEVTTKEIKAIQGIREDLQGFNGGAYGIRVNVGINFKTKNEQFLGMMSELGTKNPLIAQIMAPEIILAMGLPGAPNVAGQVERVLIKQGLREEKQEQQGGPEAVARDLDEALKTIEALQNELQQVHEAAQTLQQQASGEAAKAQAQAEAELAKIERAERIALAEIASKERIAAADRASKERIAAMDSRTKALTDLQIASMKEDGSTTRAGIDAEATVAAAALSTPSPSLAPAPVEFEEDFEPGVIVPEGMIP